MEKELVTIRDTVGFYKTMRSTECWQTNITDILSGIKNGNWADQVNRYRESGDGTIKENLPCFTVGGVFSPTKSVENLVSYSGLLSLDIDDLKTSFLGLQALVDDEFVFSIFKSASGNGYCVLIKTVPLTSVEQFKRLYQGVYEHLYDRLKNVCKFDYLPNLNRLRYVSFDEDLYLNQNCQEWSIEAEVPNLVELPIPKSDRKVSINLGQLNDSEKLDLTLSKFEEVSGKFGERGTRHDWVLSLARWCCRADIDENYLVSYILSNFTNSSRDSNIWAGEVRRCVRDSYRAYSAERGTYEVSKKFDYNDILSATNVEEVRTQLFLLIADKINYCDYLVSNKKSCTFVEKEIKFLKTLNNYL